LPHFFDVIVADLPCSGEGMFRKEPAAIAEWSVNNVRHCAERQRRIVTDIWPALKPGGILIYCTCTYNGEENEENLEWICRTFDAGLIEAPYRMMPHKVKGEGFFIAALRKNESAFSAKTTKGKNEKQKVIGKENRASYSSPFEHCLLFPDKYIFVSYNAHWMAIPEIHYSAHFQMKKHLKILSAGVTLGEIKGKNQIPAHDLAMSNALSDKIDFPRWETDKETALAYLRRDVLQNIPPELPIGYVLLTYKSHPLGFVKNIGTRINNLYPQEWRIRMKN
jgi:NOL1/NOP2/fmu family ribosome biogenesis protein